MLEDVNIALSFWFFSLSAYELWPGGTNPRCKHF